MLVNVLSQNAMYDIMIYAYMISCIHQNVVLQTIKDVNQSLVDDGMVDTDKVYVNITIMRISFNGT